MNQSEISTTEIVQNDNTPEETTQDENTVNIKKNSREKFNNTLKTVIYFALPPLTVIAVFFMIFKANGIYPFGNKTIAWCDMTQQGVPYWINFKQVLEGDQSLFLNMANAAGMDGWNLLRSYFMYPLSYLILFVDSKDVMSFVTVATVLKFALCCLTSLVFFRVCVKKLHPALAAALSMMYSFCAYGTMYYQILNWPISMYVLPLYFTGLYLLLKEHKILLFSVTIALIMRNFAFGFMAVVATLLFVGYYFIVCEDKIALKRNAFNFTIGSAFGAILSMPIWLSFFGAFSNSARGVDVASSLLTSASFTSKATVYPLLMSTAIIFVAAFLFKAVKKSPIEKAIYFVFGMMLIPMVFEPINKMWHFGSYMGFPARYAYMIVFAGLVIAGVLLSKYNFDAENGKRSQATQICSFAFLLCLSCALYAYVSKYIENNIKEMSAYATTLWGNDKSYRYMLVLFLLFIVAYALCYAFYKKKLISKQFLAIVLILVLLSEAYVSISTYVVPATAKMNMTAYSKYVDLTDRVEDDNEFFRVKNASFLNAAYGSVSEANFPGSIGYNSMGHYSSLTSESYLYAAKAYGYSSVWMKIDTYGGTKFSDALFSIKYKIDKTANRPANIVYSNDKYCIAETDNFLPLGIFTNASDVSMDIEDYTRIELQEHVFRAITNSQNNLFTELKPTKFYNCSLSEKAGNYYVKKRSSSAYIEYTVQVEGTKTLYFDCFDEFSNSLSEKINKSFAVYVNDVRKCSQYPVDTLNGLITLGTFTNETVTVKVNVLKDIECRSLGLYTMDDELLNRELSKISSTGLNVNGNTLSGNYTTTENGYVFVSVPYNPAFKCTVNGKTVKIAECFGGFIGVPVSKGENSIVLKYTPPMFYPSIIAWVLSIIVIAALVFIFKKRGINNAYDATQAIIGEKNTAFISFILLACVIIAFVAVILLVYIYPTFLSLKF